MKATAQIFISYAREDEEKVEKLYQRLSDAGFKPWMLTKDVLPGEIWQSSVERAIQQADFFLACLSVNAIGKQGFLQKEISGALEVWRENLEHDIYLIPVRLEDCEVPEDLRAFQWVDLFEENGWARLVQAIRVGAQRRAEVLKPVAAARIEMDARRLERCADVKAISRAHHSLAIGELAGIAQPDIYAAYETGLRQLLHRVERDHPRYSEALVYQQRLIENITQSRRYGDNVTLQAERSEIIAGLNALAMSQLGTSFNELAIGLSTRTAEQGPSERSHELEDPFGALLRIFSRISRDVDAALLQESTYNQRLALSAVEDRLDGLLLELMRSDERYAIRFRPIAARWRQVVADRVRALAEEAELRQEIDNPYIISVPLTAQQEIFVGRTDVSARIEQLLLDRRRPPVLLHGQRRMGKTSLLNNLGRLLPSTIVPLFVDLQGPASRASDHAGFLYNVARGMVDSAARQRELALPPLPREALAADPFTRFDEWLDAVEETLGENTALLALDEFEALDSAITKGHFDEETVLGMLRHLIQHRPRFKVLLASSHTLEELQRWASYLINVQVVHIGYLKEDEACQLIERPVKDFALRYEPEASQRVLDLTRGHPALVQLLCSEIVALKNEQPTTVRRLACLADVEAVVPEALSHGSFFFADIQQNQVDAARLALLRFLAAQGERTVISREDLARQFPEGLDDTLNLLIRRELIESADEGYRFQVELIRRWFAQ